MAGVFYCLAPCHRYFSSPLALQVHRGHNAACAARWEARLMEGYQKRAQRQDILNEKEGSPMELDQEPHEPQFEDEVGMEFNMGNPRGDPEAGDPEAGDGVEAREESQTEAESVDSETETEEEEQVTSRPSARDESSNNRLKTPSDYANEVETILFDEHEVATIIKRGAPPFNKIYQEQLYAGSGNVFYPFAGEDEWDTVVWMHQSRLSTKKIDNYLRLQYVRRRPLSFKTGGALIDRLEQLPSPGTQWKSRAIVPKCGSLLKPLRLFYRDILDGIQYLLQLPSLGPAMEFIPRRVYAKDGDEEVHRLYKEMFAGDWTWRTQREIRVGGCLLPVILASDKTHLTVLAGDKKAWPVYMSLGNIRASIRNKPSNNAWLVIAYLPQSSFDAPKGIAGMLESRVFHQCLKVIVEPLETAGRIGTEMTDSYGNTRLSFPRLGAYLGDNPEHRLLNLAKGNSSAVSIADFAELESSVPSPRRTREWILGKLDELRERNIAPDNLSVYFRESKKLGLNGVDEPFWRDLPDYEPWICVCPDLLHGIHRFWRDHVLRWVQNTVGQKELDRRLMLQQPVKRTKHFRHGISHLKQWTGREDRELQRVVFVAVQDHEKVTPDMTRALRAMHDFIYLAQYESHDAKTLELMDQALAKFHEEKQAFIDNGSRKGKKGGVLEHFRIPKLEALHHYTIHIPEMGSSPQYSTDVSELLHRPMAKQAYAKTNKREHEFQMCRYLDRCDRVIFMKEFLGWAKQEAQRQAFNLGLATPIRVMHTDVLRGFEDEPLQERRKLKDRTLRIDLTITPHHVALTIASACAMHQLHLGDVKQAINQFLRPRLPAGIQDVVHGYTVDLWDHLKLRLPTVQDDDEEYKCTIQACPASLATGKEVGRYNCVTMVTSDRAKTARVDGHGLAQVRMILRLRLGVNHPLNAVPLAVVAWFTPMDEVDVDSELYRVARVLRRDGRLFLTVEEISDIARFVHLSPSIPSSSAELANVTADFMMESAKVFYVNSFFDKQIFQSVY